MPVARDVDAWMTTTITVDLLRALQRPIASAVRMKPDRVQLPSATSHVHRYVLNIRLVPARHCPPPQDLVRSVVRVECRVNNGDYLDTVNTGNTGTHARIHRGGLVEVYVSSVRAVVGGGQRVWRDAQPPSAVIANAAIVLNHTTATAAALCRGTAFCSLSCPTGQSRTLSLPHECRSRDLALSEHAHISAIRG